MARLLRQMAPEAADDDAAEPLAVEHLTALVYALPQRVEDFTEHNPFRMHWAYGELAALCGMSALEAIPVVWPDREAYLAWLLDSRRSMFGPGDERYRVPVYSPHLYPGRFGAVWVREMTLAERAAAKRGDLERAVYLRDLAAQIGSA